VLAIPVTTLIAVLVVKATGIRTPGPVPVPGPAADRMPRERASAAVGTVDPDDVDDTGALAAAAASSRSSHATYEGSDQPMTRRGRRADRG
jgi:hypothetical protein